MNYRYKHDFTIAEIPKEIVEENRGSKCGKCCKNQLVMAVIGEHGAGKPHMNDVSGFAMKKTSREDVINFTIEKCDGTVVANLGYDAIFPNDSDADGYIFDWQLILNTYGAGSYTIKANFTLSGIIGNQTLGNYTLKPFSIYNARHSVRMYSEFDAYDLKNKIDYTGSNFKDTIRFHGKFGDRQPNTEINNLIDKGREVNSITRENVNKYKLESDPIMVCMTRQIIDKHLLKQNRTKISDYNRYNHDYDLLDVPVELIEVNDVVYTKTSRRAVVSAIFGDKIVDNRSYYRTK